MNIALLGDYREGYAPHERAMASLTALGGSHGWVPTDDLETDAAAVLRDFGGIWAGSGPYKNKGGILNGIQFAREQNVPFLGTCSGFGYTVLEFARSQFGLASVQHPHDNPDLPADALFLHPLAVCGIGTHEIEFTTRPDTLAHQIYGTSQPIREWSNCSYGIHPDQIARFAEHGLRMSASDEAGEGKLLELTHNKLFLAMLFYPQLNPAQPHPILQTFVKESIHRRNAGPSSPERRTVIIH